MLEFIILLFTYLVFGTIGLFIAKRSKNPLTIIEFFSLAFLTISSQWAMANSAFLGIGTDGIPFNYSLQALFGGILVGRIRPLIKGNKSI